MFGMDAGNLSSLIMGMFAAVGIVLGILALWMVRRRTPPVDPVLKIYRRFCQRLARAGVTRRASEGPVDFAARVITLRPQLREQVEGITAMYVALRYGEDGTATGDLRRAVSAFRPR